MCFASTVAAVDRALAQEPMEAEGSVPVIEASATLSEVGVPPRRVGQLTLRSGNVGIRATGESGWTEAELNQPVSTGGALRTDPRARAEIRVGANTIDLSNSTDIEITTLSDQVTQITLSRGRIDLHLRQADEGESVEVDIPRGGVWLLGPGNYDIDAGSSDQSSRIAVFEGKVRYVGAGNDTRIQSGDMVVLTGSDPATVTIEPATPDAFIEWSRARDYDETRLAAPYYVSPYMTGFAELDSVGSWQVSPRYGAVWVPDAIPEDWTPYRDGH
jgi:hypothetical protein